MSPKMGIWTDGGFVGQGAAPERRNPHDWIVWHFTLLDYLPEIISEGALRCDDVVPERHGSVANQDVKALRRAKMVSASGYPLGRMVSSHVPFYFAAKSPMLYVVRSNFPEAELDRLVFLGVRLGDMLDAGLSWVVSDGNAAHGLTAFSIDLGSLGDFVDFELLKAKWWNNIAEDMDRMRRRSAELLVHDAVPLTVVSQVIARNNSTLNTTRDAFTSAGYSNIEYRATNTFFT